MFKQTESYKLSNNNNSIHYNGNCKNLYYFWFFSSAYLAEHSIYCKSVTNHRPVTLYGFLVHMIYSSLLNQFKPENQNCLLSDTKQGNVKHQTLI